MIFEILGHGFAGIETLFDFGVSDVAAHDDSAREVQAGGYGEFVKFGEHFGHGTVKVDVNRIAFLGIAHLGGDEFARIGVEVFEPEAFLVDLGLDVSVGRAADAHADGAGCAVAGKADHADVVSEIFAAELGAETDFARCLEEFFLQLEIAERTAILVAGGRE